MQPRCLVTIAALVLAACEPASSQPGVTLVKVTCKDAAAETLYVNPARVEYIVAYDSGANIVFGASAGVDIHCPADSVAAWLQRAVR